MPLTDENKCDCEPGVCNICCSCEPGCEGCNKQ